MSHVRERSAPRGRHDRHLDPAFDQRGRLRLVPRSRPLWRRWSAAVAVTVGSVLAAGAFSAAQVLMIRADLLTVRSELGQGVARLPAGDSEAALEAFSTARTSAEHAEARLDHPVVVGFSLLPVAADTVRASRNLASGAGLVARAGEELSVAALTLPDGVGTLAPRDGRIPVAPIRQVAPALKEAHSLAAEAAALMETTPVTAVPREISEAVGEFDEQLAAILPTLRTAAVLADELPAFLGADGPRRYFFGAQNPSELRGTGGFLGAYTILEADNGELRFGTFTSIVDLTPTPQQGVEPPTEEFAVRYNRFAGTGFGQNTNMTPHFPTAAVALQRIYEDKKGVPLHGAIVADPYALAALLEVVGEVEVDYIGEIDTDNAVALITNEAYGRLPHEESRKEFLGDAASMVFGRFLAESGENARASTEALVDAAGRGHMLFHSNDPDTQRAFEDAGIAGGFGAAPDDDFTAVVVNNGGQNKTDYYLDRKVHYEVWLHPDGSALAELTTTFRNESPTSGMVRDVIGPNVPYLDAGDSRNYVSVYCAAACQVLSSTRDGATVEPTRFERELGHPVVSTWELTASGEERTVTHRFELPDGWDPDAGRYLLSIHDQPTIRPTEYEVTVHAPEGLAFAAASRGVGVTGEEARWQGPAPSRATELEVSVRRPGETRWQWLLQWLSEPAFRIGGSGTG